MNQISFSRRSLLGSVTLLLMTGAQYQVLAQTPASADPMVNYVKSLTALAVAMISGPADLIAKLKVQNFFVDLRAKTSAVRNAKQTVLFAVKRTNCSAGSQHEVKDAAIISEDLRQKLAELTKSIDDLRGMGWFDSLSSAFTELENSLDDMGINKSKGWIQNVGTYCGLSPNKQSALIYEINYSIALADSALAQINKILDKLAN